MGEQSGIKAAGGIWENEWEALVLYPSTIQPCCLSGTASPRSEVTAAERVSLEVLVVSLITTDAD